MHSKIAQILTEGLLEPNHDLLLEISKYYAQEVKVQIMPDVDTVEVQNFCKLIGVIVECCEENSWFQQLGQS